MGWFILGTLKPRMYWVGVIAGLYWLDIGKHITPSYLDLFQEYGMANYQCSTSTLCEINIH